jgi:glycosyltransferase involved in cell wall biosynthesis
MRFFHFQQKTASARLVFVGDYGNSCYLESLRRKVISLQLAERVTWLPFQDDIRRIHCACDVLVLPSDGEALGTCVLEAMALGKPVVVSDAGGTHELLQHETSGLVVPGGNAHALAVALQSLAERPAMRSNLGDRARHSVIERFTLRSHAERVARVIRQTDSLID